MVLQNALQQSFRKIFKNIPEDLFGAPDLS